MGVYIPKHLFGIVELGAETPYFGMTIPSYVPSIYTVAVMHMASNMELNVSNLG